MYGLPMNLHKHPLYLLEQHSESYEIWSATIRINTDGKSLNMKLGPGLDFIIKDLHPVLSQIVHAKVYTFHFQTNLSGMFKAETIVYL